MCMYVSCFIQSNSIRSVVYMNNFTLYQRNPDAALSIDHSFISYLWHHIVVHRYPFHSPRGKAKNQLSGDKLQLTITRNGFINAAWDMALLSRRSRTLTDAHGLFIKSPQWAGQMAKRVAATETKCSIVKCVWALEWNNAVRDDRRATPWVLYPFYWERPRELTPGDEVCPEIRLYR